jgi:alanyl-tRNA synthetase
MTVRELREKYLAFFESKGHHRFPSGSLIPYDVTGRLDTSLLFNGAGMIQFKPYFRGIAKPDHSRLTTCQKCVRTGDIDEVGDDTHLTFFEMLGNFSFGDYFKVEAIRYSWEFLTSPEWLGLDPERLSFTVFEDDDEAVATWLECGAQHVIRLGEETNYWPAGSFSKGPPGPCGPNSEMFYWVGDGPPPSAGQSREDWIADDAAGNWVEIWNDVFIQYEWQGEALEKGYRKTGMPDLPFRSIDTGMGLERTVMVLSGETTVYETDAFTPIFAAIDRLSGPVAGATTVARRVIADHIRTATFCIADGILPSNTGRGYVLRRLIRRATLKGDRSLGIKEPFMYRVFDGVVAAMGHAYPELEEQRGVITETLKNEEEAFRRTLRAGEERLLGLLSGSEISGADAFQLYSTYGFPLEVTQELAAEAGVTVDLEGYEVALKADQALARGAQGEKSAYGDVSVAEEQSVADAPDATEFLGYTALEATGRIVRIRSVANGFLIALDQTPFYAQSGGQAGDSGTLQFSDGAEIAVEETTKSAGIHWHSVSHLPENALGQTVLARVDGERRNRTQPHHTGTHLLHLALREALGSHATQAGSYVGPDRLRFDFTHGAALSAEQREQIERRVNELAQANFDVVTHVDISPEEAKARGAMALFGEKYGDKVRMVEVGPSKELCGGTHVRTSAEVLPFRILAESSAASGVRRIEAVAGAAAREQWARENAELQKAAALLKSTPAELAASVEKTILALREEKAARQKAERASMATGTVTREGSEIKMVGSVELWVMDFGDKDAKLAAEQLDNFIATRPAGVGLVATQADGKITFAAKAGPDAVKAGAHVGNVVKELARIAGGGGGGRPDFATAGGRDVTKLAEALAAAEAFVQGQLK